MSKITIDVAQNIVLLQDSILESFVGQFQKYCPDKVLCVYNGSIIKFYNKSMIFTDLKFDYEQKHEGITEYYFHHLSNNSTYCFFDETVYKSIVNLKQSEHPLQLKRFTRLPFQNNNTNVSSNAVQTSSVPQFSKRPPIIQQINKINENKSTELKVVEPQKDLTNILVPVVYDHQEKNIIIVDDGEKLSFPAYDFPVEIVLRRLKK